MAKSSRDLAAALGVDHVQVKIPRDSEDGVGAALERGGVSWARLRRSKPYDMAE